ncbi:MAG: transglutaminase family protein [Solirubrobacterales bacterium]
MTLFRPVSARITRPLSLLFVLAWLVQMGLVLRQAYLSAPVALAADLARYGSSAQWRGVYYRGDKIGFSVGQTLATAEGFELQEDGRLQMTLLGSTTAVRLRSVARVDKAFALKSFSFSLDPGTGPTEVEGTLDGLRLHLAVTTPSGRREETRELREAPTLSLNLSRRLAAEGLEPGKKVQVMVFDPATLRNAPMTLEVQARDVVWVANHPVPAFRVESRYAGIVTKSWINDVGEVVREESPMGLIVVRETRDRAQMLGVPGAIQTDILEAAAIVPDPPRRIDDPATVLRLRLRLQGAEGFAGADLVGAGQTVAGDVFEMRDTRALAPGPADPESAQFLAPEPFLESDAPEIIEEARRAVADATDGRTRAERLVRHVHAILRKKPTVSLPSALEVLKTRVGDCNEHTALYVAMARALGLPARTAVGLVYLRGAFYYHAWAEVYLAGSEGRGLWLPVDPTLDQFPADATHVRLARGGLDKQGAILGLVGRAKISVLDLELRPGSVPILVGREATDLRPLDVAIPRREASRRGCWSSPGR